jgi:hypothetical protein
MNTEANNKYNKGLAEITGNLYQLRKIEYSSRSMKYKYRVAKPLLERVTQLLLKKKNFLLYRPMWNELHDRMVFYYDYRNKKNLNKSIPLFSITLHNEAVRWWLLYKKKGHLSSTLLHFDTHDDMGLPETKKGLLTAKGKLDYKNIRKGSCGQIYWPVTCMLLSEGIDNVIWCIPSWVYDTNLSNIEQALVHYKKDDKFAYLRSEGSKKDDYVLDVDIIPDIDKTTDMDFYQSHKFSRLKVTTTNGWARLSKNIGSESKFILDIDLDFFVTNGDAYSTEEYKDDFGDLESTGRVHGVPGITVPRAAYEDDASQHLTNKLNKEFGLIKKRVKIFLDGLRLLKKRGQTPCCISIADSAPSFFSGKASRAVWTNSYTPKYFIPVLRYLLSEGLRNIYVNEL